MDEATMRSLKATDQANRFRKFAISDVAWVAKVNVSTWDTTCQFGY